MALLPTVRAISKSMHVAATAVLVKLDVMAVLVKIGAALILKRLAVIVLLMKLGVLAMEVKLGVIAELMKMGATVMGMKMAAVAVLMKATNAASQSMAPAPTPNRSPPSPRSPRIVELPTGGLSSSPPSLANTDTCVRVCGVRRVAGSTIEVKPRSAWGFSVRVLLMGLPHRTSLSLAQSFTYDPLPFP